MNLLLNNTNIYKINGDIIITGSKSESNRLLILRELYDKIKLDNLSNSDDTLVLQKALKITQGTVDIGHAGTAMRFLTAYFSSFDGANIILTGSKRMHQRPIKVLVEALRSLGADITYLKNNGYPPLRITGKELIKDYVTINGNVSSQYISALLLISPSLKKGLTLELEGNITSVPYIKMTLSLLKNIGVKYKWIDNIISIEPLKSVNNKKLIIESDWSSASYYYSLVALSKNGKVKLSSFNKNSLQGDSDLTDIYTNFGVKTTFLENSIVLEKKSNFHQKNYLKFDLKNTPDIAQTIVVTCLGLGISCGLEGLHTLKIKETDRLEALKTELQKFGAKVRITDDSLHMKCYKLPINNKPQTIINTYDDHRMAMAFAPLSLIYSLKIIDSFVVHKSYPDFWDDLSSILNK